ncbi:MAG TPA: hypothetical protein DDX39_04140 [Bacteroidales bacterium]|nr:MAG: hypothetical protein A2W98_09300 [Bacteroidetes bacterium GWF2_33_38]OFY75289.1 MAG: hypothetical protein A2265_10125 [Bacteroidetes bacterium RIFOXYA12_FULL_33_9]HBF87812.1 hypothetical protein [Bacteroidales bacterium]
MPIIYYDKKPDDIQIGIWKIDESEEFLFSISNLDKEDARIYCSFSLELRRKQWLVARLLANKIVGDNSKIIYNSIGKPFLKCGNFHISLSHTSNYLTLIASRSYEVGIDIEHLSDRIYRLAHKFMHDNEMKRIEKKNELLYLYLSWSAKEAVYKIYNDTHLFFKDIQVISIDFLSCTMAVNVNNDKYKHEFIMNYRIFDNNILVWTKKS